MDNSGFTLKTAETWKRHGSLENEYSEQLSYAVFGSVLGKVLHLPENLIEAVLESSSRGDIDFFDGFSLATGRHKVIASDRPLIFASPEE